MGGKRNKVSLYTIKAEKNVSGVQGIHWVSQDTSIQGNIGKYLIVSITAQ